MGFISAQATFLLLSTSLVSSSSPYPSPFLSAATPTTAFSFDGEFSIVADPAGGLVADRIERVQEVMGQAVGLVFGKERDQKEFRSEPDGSVIGRFWCVHDVLLPVGGGKRPQKQHAKEGAEGEKTGDVDDVVMGEGADDKEGPKDDVKDSGNEQTAEKSVTALEPGEGEIVMDTMDASKDVEVAHSAVDGECTTEKTGESSGAEAQEEADHSKETSAEAGVTETKEADAPMIVETNAPMDVTSPKDASDETTDSTSVAKEKETMAVDAPTPVMDLVLAETSATGVVLKRMTGELEVSVLWDRSHPLVPGLRTIVRFRMVG